MKKLIIFATLLIWGCIGFVLYLGWQDNNLNDLQFNGLFMTSAVWVVVTLIALSYLIILFMESFVALEIVGNEDGDRFVGFMSKEINYPKEREFIYLSIMHPKAQRYFHNKNIFTKRDLLQELRDNGDIFYV